MHERMGPLTSRQRLLVTLAAVAILLDRIAWASVAQWREDQGTSMWLALDLFRRFPSVGLVSSVGLPNPNGIALVALPLTWLPSLLSVSTVLGCLAAASVFVLCRATGAAGRFSWPLALVMWSSVPLRGASVELWGQWLMIPLNLLFVAVVVRFWRQPSTWLWIPFLLLVLAAPSLYLAGVLNAVIYCAVWLVVLFRVARRDGLGAALPTLRVIPVLVSLLVISAVLTWIPYFRSVPVRSVLGGRQGGSALTSAAEAVILLPASVRALIRGDFAPLAQSDPRIVPMAATLLAGLGAFALSISAASSAAALILHVRRGGSSHDCQWMPATAVASAMILLAYPLSPLLGGFAWHAGQRLDQAIQFLPLVLIVIIAPAAHSQSNLVRRSAIVMVTVFVLSQAVAGWLTIAAHHRYRGTALTEADVPLLQKMRVARFIAEDAGTRPKGTPVGVTYDLIGKWTWLPELGLATDQWHPGVMRVGRSFDYELRRRFGILNAGGDGDLRPYVVSYAFEPAPPNVEGTQERIIGRLRVSTPGRQ